MNSTDKQTRKKNVFSHASLQLITDYEKKSVQWWLATGWWFSPGIPVSSTNKTGSHNITEILLKMVCFTINLTKPKTLYFYLYGNSFYCRVNSVQAV